VYSMGILSSLIGLSSVKPVPDSGFPLPPRLFRLCYVSAVIDRILCRYHRANADGSISPVVDDVVFPDMKALVDKIHAKGLKAGW